MAPVDTARLCPTAHQELRQHTSGGAGWRRGTGIGSAGDRWPVLGDAALIELVGLYQQGLEARAGSGTGRRVRRDRQLAAGQWAAEALCGSMFRLAQRICAEQGAGRRVELEDLNSLAMAAVLDAARHFDPERHSAFAPWAAGWIRKMIAGAVSRSGDGSIPASWRKVGRTAWGVSRDFEQRHGRAPSGDELQEQTRALITARARATALANNPDMSAEQLEANVRRSLSKYGLNAALERLGEVMAAVQSGVSLHRPVSDGADSATLGDLIAGGDDVEGDALAQEESAGHAAVVRAVVGTDPVSAAATLRYLSIDPDNLGASDEEGVTYLSVAEAYEIDQSLLRSSVRQARSRVGAPHAHFAHLAPDAENLLRDARPPTFASLAQR